MEDTNVDIDFGDEFDNSEREFEAAQDKVPLTVPKEQYEDLYNKYLRSRADFENYQKRVQRDQANLINSANRDLILDMLCVVDDMERLIKSSDDNVGFNLIYQKFLNILLDEGCEKIEIKAGDKFDVNIHEALMTEPLIEGMQSDTISQVIQSGWILNGKLLRPAKVGVYA